MDAVASIDCLATPLRGVLAELAAAFGPITVRWTCRDKQLNARVGGAKRSYHLTGNAVDFNMTGNYRAILAFLKGEEAGRRPEALRRGRLPHRHRPPTHLVAGLGLRPARPPTAAAVA